MDIQLRKGGFAFWLIIAAFLAGFFLFIFLLDFDPGDDLIILHTVKTQTVSEIFTTTIFGRGEYYRPLLMLTAKALLTPSLSPVPFRAALVLMCLLIMGLMWWCLRSSRVSAVGLTFAALCLIGSPMTSGAFSWWADLGSRYAMIAFLIGAGFIMRSQKLSWKIAVPVLIFALLSQEIALAIAFTFFCYALSKRQWKTSGAIVALVIAYFAVRFLVIGALFSKSQYIALPTMFLFSPIVTIEELTATFGNPPILLYLYNIASQLSAVFMMEPWQGQLLFTSRTLSLCVLQTLSSVVLFTYLWIRRRQLPFTVWPLFLTILTNVLISYATLRFRTLSLAGVCWIILFAIAADDLWKTKRFAVRFILSVLLIGWMARAGLVIVDLRDQVREQANIYRTLPPDPSVDPVIYEQVRAKYL